MGKRDLRTSKRPWCILPLPVSALCQVFLILYIIELVILQKSFQIFSRLIILSKFVLCCQNLSLVNICLIFSIFVLFCSIFVNILSLFVKIRLYLSIVCQNLSLLVYICLYVSLSVFFCLYLSVFVKICLGCLKTLLDSKSLQSRSSQPVNDLLFSEPKSYH